RAEVDGQVPASVCFLYWPEVRTEWLDYDLARRFEALLAFREDVNLLAERPRAEGRIGTSLDAGVGLQPKIEALKGLDPKFLETFLIVSEVADALPAGAEALAERECENCKLIAYRPQAVKCIRCWRYDPTVGSIGTHPEICARCAEAVT